MKLIQIDKTLINLDKVIKVDLEENIIYLQDNHKINVNPADIEDFVFQYNLVDTDELRKIVGELTRLTRLDPNILSRSSLEETITIMVRMYNLVEDLKEETGTKRLRELSITELVRVYKVIRQKAEEAQERNPF